MHSLWSFPGALRVAGLTATGVICLATACGKSDKKGEPPGSGGTQLTPSELPTPRKSYQYQGAGGCSTGKQSFYEADDNRLQLSYCEALLDNERNNNCARDLRHLEFKAACVDQMSALGVIVDAQGNIVPVPALQRLEGTYAAELLLVDNWVDSIKTESESIVDAIKVREAEIVAEALRLCGQEYLGPACHDFAGHDRLAAGLLETKAGGQVYYYLARYRHLQGQFLWVYPVEYEGEVPAMRQGSVSTWDGDPFFFRMKEDYRKDEAVTHFADFAFSKLTRERAFAHMGKAEVGTSLIHLSRWAQGNVLFDDETAAVNAKVLAILDEKTEVIEAIDAPDYLESYIQVLKAALSPSAFEAKLSELTEAENAKLSVAAAVHLMTLRPDMVELLPLLFQALKSDYHVPVEMGLAVLEADAYDLTQLQKEQLIRLFSYPRAGVGERAHEILIAAGVDSDLIRPLQVVFNGGNDQAKKQAFLTLAAVDDPKVKELLIDALTKIKDPVILSEMTHAVTELRFGAEDIDQLDEMITRSPSEGMTRQLFAWMASIKTPEAYRRIISRLKDEKLLLRYLAGETLDALTVFRENYPQLLDYVAEAPPDAVGFAAGALLRAKTVDGYTVVIFELGDDDPFRRGEVIEALRKTPAIQAGAVSLLAKHFAGPYEDVWLALPGLLAAIETKDSTKALLENLGHSLSQIRQDIIAILMRRPYTDMDLAKLQSYIESPYIENAETVIHILGTLNTGDSNAKMIQKIHVTDRNLVDRMMAFLSASTATIAEGTAETIKKAILMDIIRADVKPLLLSFLLRWPADKVTGYLIDVLGVKEDSVRADAFAEVKSRKVTTGMLGNIKVHLASKDRDVQEWSFERVVENQANTATHAMIDYLTLTDDAMRERLLQQIAARPGHYSMVRNLVEQALKTVYKNVAAACVEKIATIDAYQSIEGLVSSLATPFQELVPRIIDLIEAKGDLPATTSDELSTQILKLPDLTVVARLVEMLVSIPGPQAAKALAMVMSHPDGTIRAAILKHVRERTPDKEMVLDLRTQGLTTKFTEVVSAAVEKLAEIQDVTATEALIDSLATPFPEHVPRIMEILMERGMGGGEHEELSKQILKHTDHGVVMQLIELLGSLSDYYATRALIRLLPHPDAEVRARVFELIEPRDVNIVWTETYSGGGPYGSTGQTTVSEVTMAYDLVNEFKNTKITDNAVKDLVIRKLATIEHRTAVSSLVGILTDKYAPWLDTIIAGIRNAKHTVGYDDYALGFELTKRFKEPDVNVRIVAVEVYEQLIINAPFAPGGISTLTELMDNDMPEVRAEIYRVLDGRYGNPEAKIANNVVLGHLGKHLSSPNVDVRSKACEYLGKLNDQAGLELLRAHAAVETDASVLAVISQFVP